MPEYLSRKQVAELLGVKTDSLNGYNLPPADFRLGTHRGWLKETILQWDKDRPGRGNWRKDEDGEAL